MIRTFPIALLFSLLIITSCEVSSSNKSFQLQTETIPAEGGSIEHEKGPFERGDLVELSAVPNEGYEFSHWEEDSTDIENPKSIYVNSDKKVVAVFEEIRPVSDMYPLQAGRKWTYSYYYSDLDHPYENERNGQIIHEVIKVEEKENEIIYTISEIFEYVFVIYDQGDKPLGTPVSQLDTLSVSNYSFSDTFQITEKLDGSLFSTGAETFVSTAFDTSSHILTYGYDGTSSYKMMRYVPIKRFSNNTLIAYDNLWPYFERPYTFRADSGIVNFSIKDRNGLWMLIELQEME